MIVSSASALGLAGSGRFSGSMRSVDNGCSDEGVVGLPPSWTLDPELSGVCSVSLDFDQGNLIATQNAVVLVAREKRCTHSKPQEFVTSASKVLIEDET